MNTVLCSVTSVHSFSIDAICNVHYVQKMRTVKMKMCKNFLRVFHIQFAFLCILASNAYLIGHFSLLTYLRKSVSSTCHDTYLKCTLRFNPMFSTGFTVIILYALLHFFSLKGWVIAGFERRIDVEYHPRRLEAPHLQISRHCFIVGSSETRTSKLGRCWIALASTKKNQIRLV